MRIQTSQKAELFIHTLRMIFLGVFAVFVSALILTLTFATQTDAASSSNINFQARLENATGSIAADGTYNVEFKLYNASSSSGSSQGSCTGDANCLWVEDYLVGSAHGVQVVNGYLTVNLGSITAFPTNMNWNQQLWLTMRIGGTGGSPSWDTEMSPRLLLTATPYSFQAGQLYTTNSGFAGTLSFANMTVGNNAIVIPDTAGAGGTVCLQGSSSCGFAASSGATGYIQNQNASPQTTANFNISGGGTAATFNATTGIYTGASSGTERIDSSGDLLNIADITTTNMYITNVTRTLPTTVGNEVDIGSFALTNGGGGFDIKVTVPSSGFSVAKTYSFGVNFSQTAGVWVFVQPTSDTGPYSGNDFTLEANVNSGTLSLRLRRSAGTTAGTANIVIQHEGVAADVFTPSSATSSVSAPTTYLSDAILSQASGNVSIQGGLTTTGTINSQTISSAASFTGTVNVATGYQIAGAATTGNYLRGNGTNFVSSAIQSGDIPSGSAFYIQNQNASVQTTANFKISGTGQASAFDNSTAATLNIGTSTATNVTIGQAVNTSLVTVNDALTVTGVAPGSLVGNGTTATGALTVNGGAGGATSGTANTAGTGAALTLQGGAGGNATAVTGTSTAGTGGTITVKAGNGGTNFNASGTNGSGGSIILQPGAGGTGGTGNVDGSVIVQPQSGGDSSTAFQVQNAAGSTILATDTTANTLNLSGNINFNQVAGPSSAPTFNSFVGSGSLTGSFYYVVSYITASGITNYGPVSSVISPSAQNVVLNIPVSPSNLVTGRNIYRATISTGPFLKVGQTNSSATTFTDSNTSPTVTASDINQSASFEINGVQLLQVDSGSSNTSLGYLDLQNVSTGVSNTGIGHQTLQSDTTGSANTALGNKALQNTTTGGNNTAVGRLSFSNNTTGSYNTALGYYAGYQDSGGNFVTGAALQNATAIGSYAQVQANNSIVLGSVDTATSVGIGTTVPLNTFSVSPMVYNTGTACSVASSGSATCTGTATAFLFGSGTTWTSSMVGDELIFADGQERIISAVTSTTAITLASALPTGEATGSFYRIHVIGLQVTSSGNVFVQNTSSTEFQVQNTSGSTVLAVDTSGDQVVLGKLGSSGFNGTLVFNSATSGNYTTTLIASSSQSSNYTLTLPTTAASTGQCLLAGTVSAGVVPLTWGTCAVTHSKQIILTPEYAGAVLDNGGAGNDIGTMTSGFDSTQRESYYQWTTNQGSNQVYDVVAQIPVPSDFSSWASTTPITVDIKTSNTTNGTVIAKLIDTGGTTEGSWNTCSLTPATTSWTTKTGCTVSGTYNPNGIMTLRIIMQAPSSGTTELGNIVLSYNSVY